MKLDGRGRPVPVLLAESPMLRWGADAWPSVVHDALAARRARERNGITGRRSDGLGLWGLASRVAIDDWASRGIGRPGNGPIGSTSESWVLFLVENGLQTHEIEASYTIIY